MNQRFTRWGKRAEQPKTRQEEPNVHCAPLTRPTFKAPILADEAPALPSLQLRAFNHCASVEKRAVAGAAHGAFRGHIPYSKVIQGADGCGELFKPGCFAASMKQSDLRVIADYNDDRILGRMSAGTCSFSDQAAGLYFETQAPATSWATDLVASMQRGDIGQAGVAFRTMAFDWIELDGKKCRAITRAKLAAVSISSSIAMQGAAQAIAAVRAGRKRGT